MKKERILQLLRLYAWPVFLTIVGLVLLFSPDTASALIAKAVGWILIVVGAVRLFTAVMGGGYERARSIAFAVICLGVGIFVVSFPLILAEALGRFVGIFLVIQGVSGIRKALQSKRAELHWQYAMAAAVVTLAAGIVLALLPLTLSRIILNICGVVLIVIGIVNILGTYREQKFLEDGGRPHIIDADE